MPEEQPAGIEPVYLTLGDILELYGLIIGATAAEAGDQLRNRDGLEGTLARPETYAHYQEADLALQAAVLAHGIAEGQQFIDGNKRTALVAMLTFLEINGWRVEASDPELADFVGQGLEPARCPPESPRALARHRLLAVCRPDRVDAGRLRGGAGAAGPGAARSSRGAARA